MKTTKILLGGLAGGITFFLLGWVIYGLLLANYTAANFNQDVMKPMEEMNWLAIILSNFAFGFLLSFVIGWSNIKGWKTGAKAGIVIGFLYSASVDLSMYSMSDWFLNIGSLVVDIIVLSVISAVIGIVVALVMGAIKAAPAD